MNQANIQLPNYNLLDLRIYSLIILIVQMARITTFNKKNYVPLEGIRHFLIKPNIAIFAEARYAHQIECPSDCGIVQLETFILYTRG